MRALQSTETSRYDIAGWLKAVQPERSRQIPDNHCVEPPLRSQRRIANREIHSAASASSGRASSFALLTNVTNLSSVPLIVRVVDSFRKCLLLTWPLERIFLQHLTAITETASERG
jgi:hypothetical protein